MRKDGERGGNDRRQGFPEVLIGDFEILFQASARGE
jgi:hypothetical protein